MCFRAHTYLVTDTAVRVCLAFWEALIISHIPAISHWYWQTINMFCARYFFSVCYRECMTLILIVVDEIQKFEQLLTSVIFLNICKCEFFFRGRGIGGNYNEMQHFVGRKEVSCIAFTATDELLSSHLGRAGRSELGCQITGNAASPRPLDAPPVGVYLSW